MNKWKPRLNQIAIAIVNIIAFTVLIIGQINGYFYGMKGIIMNAIVSPVIFINQVMKIKLIKGTIIHQLWNKWLFGDITKVPKMSVLSKWLLLGGIIWLAWYIIKKILIKIEGELTYTSVMRMNENVVERIDMEENE